MLYQILLQGNNFSNTTDGQLIFIAVILFATLFAAIKLLSPVSMVAWSFTAIAGIGYLEFDIDETIFWFSFVILALALGISVTVKAFYQRPTA